MATTATTTTAVAINGNNADLLRGRMPDWLPDVVFRRPFYAVVDDDQAVSVCASARMTDAAAEAGVETVAAYRGRGYAVTVVAAWAAAVEQMGALPLYSTSWDNAASRAVAARLGSSPFGADFHVT